MGMADGYAQASGNPAFVNLDTSGGLGHGMGAIMNAKIARSVGEGTATQGAPCPRETKSRGSAAAERPSLAWAHGAGGRGQSRR